MRSFFKKITPLLIVGLWTLGTGIYLFTLDSGEEGWGYLIAIMIILFSLIPFGIDFILKKIITDNKKILVIQIILSIIIVILYWKWELIGF